jgi:hypothetical protein
LFFACNEEQVFCREYQRQKMESGSKTGIMVLESRRVLRDEEMRWFLFALEE